jgi:hypothetical protein
MRRVKQLHYLNLVKFLLKLFILILHPRILPSSIRETHIGIILIAFEITAELIMRRKFGCIFSELLDSLISCFSIRVILLTNSLLFFT